MPDPVPPSLVASRAGVNIVHYDGYFYRVPQRLGTMCLEVRADRQHPEVWPFIERANALASITWADRARYPLYLAHLWLRDCWWGLTGHKPTVKKCPGWDAP